MPANISNWAINHGARSRFNLVHPLVYVYMCVRECLCICVCLWEGKGVLGMHCCVCCLFSHAFCTELYLESARIRADATHGTRGRVGVDPVGRVERRGGWNKMWDTGADEGRR